MLILASQSPRRKELLRLLGIPFKSVRPRFDEEIPANYLGRYTDIVRRLARSKAESVTHLYEPPILAADTIVVCEKEILGKPIDLADARRMMRRLAGREHIVYTGIALIANGQLTTDYEQTKVAFRELSHDEIERYLETGEPQDKAGAYAIQGKGAALISAVRGCYTNVIGLPIPKVLMLLKKSGLNPVVKSK